jgi:multiple sugar transport system substrate-binding protein
MLDSLEPKKEFMKKLAILGAFGVVAAATSWAQQTPADLVKAQCARATTVAEFWHGFRDAAQQNVLNALAAEFNKSNQGVCVQPIGQGGYGDLSTKIKAGFAAGKVPAMAQAFENNIALYLEAEKLSDLKAIGVRPQYLQKRFIDAATFKGVLYGMPFNKSVQLMYFNKDLLKKYNAKVPTSLDEFTQTVKDISKAQNAPAFWFQPSASTFAPIFLTLGGDYEVNGKLQLNSPTAIKALQWFIDLTNQKAARPITSGFINSQLNDTYGFSMDTSAGMPFYKSAAKFNLGISTLPGVKRGVPGVALIQGTNLVVFNDAPKAQQALAAKFMNFAAQPRNSAIFATQTGYVPSSDLAQETAEYKAFTKTNPDFDNVIKQARFANFEPRLADWEAIRFNILEAGIKEAVAGKVSAKEALDKAQKQAEDLLSGKTK